MVSFDLKSRVRAQLTANFFEYSSKFQRVFIHFSDGVGISASLAAIDIGIQSLEDKRNVDVYNIVKAVRKDRAGAVQIFGQYKFIYQVSVQSDFQQNSHAILDNVPFQY